MSTAGYATPIRSRVMETPKRKEEVAEVIRKVQKLRNLTKETGFYTTRSVGQLLANLTPDELCEVNDAIQLTPRELPR
jgi:hypothetical protein